MKIHQFSQLGTRDNQEDALHTGNGMYLVCDGMGGHAKGEVASNFIIDWFILAGSLIQKRGEAFSKQNLQQLAVDAQLALNDQYGHDMQTTGMGTTFCGVFSTPDSLYMAYAGDSRIYWVKPAQGKIWHTWDHSLVGELMKQGEITREEGRTHPMANRISRAFVANAEGKTVIPDIFRADDVAAGDLFLICSDGVTEAWPEAELVSLLCSGSYTAAQKFEIIQNRCTAQSKDNNTAILLEATEDDIIATGNNEEITWLSADDLAIVTPQTIPDTAHLKDETVKNTIVPETALNSKSHTDTITAQKRTIVYLVIALATVLGIIAFKKLSH